MAFVSVPKDLTKIKNKVVLNLTKRQLVCLVAAAAVGLPFYFLTKNYIGTSNAATGMVLFMLPAFLFAMYEKDGLPAEKVVKNIIRARFTRPGIRPYQTQNIYAPFTGRGPVRKEDAIADHKTKTAAQGRQGQKAGGPVRPAVNPLYGDAPGRGVQAPRRALHKNRGI